MVYVYASHSRLKNYVGKSLSVDEIKDTLVDLGMDIKGEEKLDNNDVELKVEITAEKTDLVSTVGIARAIKYYRGIETKLKKYDITRGKNKVIVKKSAKEARPKTSCVILRGIKMTDELLNEMIEIQEKIHDSFGRNRKKVSIGIYPCDEFSFPVTFTGEKPENIKFIPLESEIEMNGNDILEKHDTGKKFAHLIKGQKLYPVFRDSKGKVLSMPPIINSHETGRVNTNHKDLFIECSGHNLAYLDNIMKVMVTTFIDMGAKAESVIVEYEGEETYELNLDNYYDDISLDYINKLIGINLKENEIEKLLNKVNYGLKEIKKGIVTVEIPCFKSDVWHSSDIADDIARAYGYNNIKPRFPSISTIGKTLSKTDLRERINTTMVSLGFLEVYSYILTSTNNQFDNMCLNKNNFKYIKLIDSADEGLNMCRVNILPEILSSLHINRKNKYPQKIFENGFTIQVDNTKDTKARNELRLSCAIADSKANYTNIKEVFDSINSLNELSLSVEESNFNFLIEGRSAKIMKGKDEVGFIGEINPQVLENFGILVPIVVFEFKY